MSTPAFSFHTAKFTLSSKNPRPITESKPRGLPMSPLTAAALKLRRRGALIVDISSMSPDVQRKALVGLSSLCSNYRQRRQKEGLPPLRLVRVKNGLAITPAPMKAGV